MGGKTVGWKIIVKSSCNQTILKDLDFLFKCVRVDCFVPVISKGYYNQSFVVCLFFCVQNNILMGVFHCFSTLMSSEYSISQPCENRRACRSEYRSLNRLGTYLCLVHLARFTHLVESRGLI